MRIIIDVEHDGSYFVVKSEQLPRGIGCHEDKSQAIEDFFRVALGQIRFGKHIKLPFDVIVGDANHPTHKGPKLIEGS
jgi:hypothetical protein